MNSFKCEVCHSLQFSSSDCEDAPCIHCGGKVRREVLPAVEERRERERERAENVSSKLPPAKSNRRA